ncbi:MAG: tape measure protein [Spirochaetaceae bacterium]|nr:tape measure protein [Spirochaetaceae bacterium]
MQVTDELRVVVEAEVERALQNFEKLNKGVEKAEKKTTNLSKALDKIAKPAMIVSTALATSGVAAIKFAGELEQTQIALEVLLKDAEKATQIKDEWTQLASSTPFSTSDIDSAGKKLLAFNIESEKVTDTLRRIGDISAATGSSISEIADIYGKAAVQGRLFAEDINQFQGRGIPVVQALAKVLNVAETEIRGMVTEAKIGFPELEKAFNFMTDEGGQFAGMMDKLSESTLGKFSTTMDNAKLALASFGEVMQPTANALLEFANDFFEGIQNMDEGTKAFVTGFASVVAISGPTILAIKGIKLALTGLAANPVVLAIAGVTAGVATLTGVLAKAQVNAEKNRKAVEENGFAYKKMLEEYSDGNASKTIDEELTKQLLDLYPQLDGKLIAHKTTVEEVTKALNKLNEARIIERTETDFINLNNELFRLKELESQLDEIGNSYLSASAKNKKYWKDLGREQLETINQSKEIISVYAESINRELSKVGKTLDENFNIIDLPPIEIETKVEETPEPPKPKADDKKKWQEWFKEITGVKESFTLGAEAGKLYVNGLEQELKNAQALSEALGEKFDIKEYLESQMSEIKSTLEQLLTIPADEIDEVFNLQDKSIDALIEKYKALAEQIKNTTDYTKEQFDSWQDYINDGVDKLFTMFPQLDQEMKAFAQGMATDFIQMSLDGMIDGLDKLGEALGKGEDGATAFKDSMTNMLQTLLDNLPTMLLNAGLQLIGQGQIEIGLGLIAMSGITAFTGGLVKGHLSKDDEVEENAKGGVYGSLEYSKFAKGGAFTNSIIDSPTFFKFAKGDGFGTGLMGEAGPEAIMPLKRTSDGSLGVDATGVGGTTNVVVEINNYSSEEISATESEIDGQKTIQVTIGKMINNHISEGKADKAMSARYGLSARGV